MIWIIEPHGDDAYLSLHEHIIGLWADLPKTIVTVYCDDKRANEAKQYASAVNCSHRALRHVEGGGLDNEPGKLSPWSQWGIKLMPGDHLVAPLGLQHCEHLTVRDALPSRLNTLYYLDTPYYAKQKLRQETNDALKGCEIHSFAYASAKKWKHIPLFKSQGRYFFHHPPADLPKVELVVKIKPANFY